MWVRGSSQMSWSTSAARNLGRWSSPGRRDLRGYSRHQPSAIGTRSATDESKDLPRDLVADQPVRFGRARGGQQRRPGGGSLDHAGPVFPGADWGDIIPPYSYVDSSGTTQIFPGYNWTPDGQAIWEMDATTAGSR